MELIKQFVCDTRRCAVLKVKVARLSITHHLDPIVDSALYLDPLSATKSIVSVRRQGNRHYAHSDDILFRRLTRGPRNDAKPPMSDPKWVLFCPSYEVL